MVDFFDTRVLRGSRTRIVLDNGKLEEIAQVPFQGASVRALFGGAWGFVTTDRVDGLGKEIDLAKRIARKIGRQEDLRLAEAPPGRSVVVAVKRDPRDLSLEEKVALLREIEDAAKVDGVSSTQAVYSEMDLTAHYSSSEGLDLESRMTRVGFVISAVAHRNGLYQTDGEGRAGVGGLEIFDRENPQSLARQVGETAVALLDARAARGGSYPVVLDQELAGVFVHEAVGHATEGDIILEGDSCLEGRLGERIGSELVTVKDDPSLMLNGYYPFDDEGSLAQETVLVENGVLRSYLNTRETAARLGGVPGNARAEGMSRPVVRMSNTYIANGDWKLEEILEELKSGVYLAGSRGGQVSTGEGIFQFNAKKGYIIEDGERTQLLRDVSLSGKILETLLHVKAVGDDLKYNSGRCGKSGQLVPVSDGSPHLLVEQATVGGTG
ncbi:MAG TPA: TldD/PmbA family protein [Methanothrix sp.]|jgi:TldD protein|uniref:TldD/PmbA family protein n=1 Tax=Methanothrix sp. TaxID=90426 RepID=UPI002C005F8F|nr:TldD/PmbA family protein [Methanothrix sp.]MDI9416613.1 TldD/PmbA family protein [Euryarchaeota archaeon]HON36055.1 TldD/PmbA family protein [Methanothrix sp.]HRU75502.1 TldD/PmbA family protein [Methanothrix sp.]